MILKPDFYDRFQCKAGACTNTCCKTWEIDIDDETALYYEQVPGVLGDRIRQAMAFNEEGAYFGLNEAGFCPLLRKDGLCDIICGLGDEALCDICALHPRFFLDVQEHEFWGVGLCCEAAAELLTESEKPLTFISEDPQRTWTIEEILDALDLPDDKVQFVPARPDATFWQRLKETEAVDDAWPGELSELLEAAPDLQLPQGPYYDRILTYFLYRLLELAEEVPLAELKNLAQDMTALVALMDALHGKELQHICRISEQIEYSTVNVDILLSRLP